MDSDVRKRLRWVQLFEELKNCTQVCLKCGISRPTLRKWLKRYQQRGLDGLVTESRRPDTSPESGTTIASDILQLEEFEKTVFVLADKYPATAGKYGCIEFTGSGLAAMGLRFNPNGSFTSTHAITIH